MFIKIFNILIVQNVQESLIAGTQSKELCSRMTMSK